MQPSNEKIELHGDEIFGQNTSLPRYLYVPSINKYLSRDDGSFYSDDDFDFFAKLEKAWKESIADIDPINNLELFFTKEKGAKIDAVAVRQAKQVLKKHLKDEIKKCNEDLLEAERIETEGKNLIQWKSRERNHWFWEGILDVLLVQPLRGDKDFGENFKKYGLGIDRNKIIKRNQFLLNSMKKREDDIATSGVSDDQIRQAKQIPIRNFIKVNHSNKAVCLFHNDRHPSMHIYKDNHYYCFVCNASGDVVDLVMKLRNVSFIDAVKSLL